MTYFRQNISLLCLPISALKAVLLSFIVTLTATAAQEHPEIPTIERPVHLTDNQAYERPYMPVYRTTADGRIGVNFKEGVRVYSFNPEKYNNNFYNTPTSQSILGDTWGYRFSKTDLLVGGTNNGIQNHIGMCEAPADNNPTACGDDDCYKVTFVTAVWSDAMQETRQLIGTPATIYVSDPKTANASIRDVVLETPTIGSTKFTIPDLFEPIFTRDGNLLIGRIQDERISWDNDATGETGITRRYDMVYLPSPADSSQACDVEQWTTIKPMGHAPYDPLIKDRYGFAMNPFRDAMGNVIPDGVDLAGSYPWTDSKGDNIVFSTLATAWDHTDFTSTCIDSQPNCTDADLHNGDPALMGKTIVGLWTKGKMVLMDNLINNIDYSKPATKDSGHRMLDMYLPNSKADGSGSGLVRVGNGRDNSIVWTAPAGSAHNTTFVESTENKLRYWENLKTITPRDVVWRFSNGVGSDEFAFDDHMYPDSFIISTMVQAVSNDGNTVTQYNGLDGNASKVENSATTTSERWLTPTAGDVINARIETVAQGGIMGKGLWLADNGYIHYPIATQPQDIRAKDWQISLFVDARFDNDNNIRTLFATPDGSELELIGRDQVRYIKNSTVLRTIDLPHAIPSHGWAHFTVQMSEQNKVAELYFDGFLLDSYTHSSEIFEMSQGNLYVGGNPTSSSGGFYGWVDNFKVIALNEGAEVKCNHASGTLVGFDDIANMPTNSQGYPLSSHQAITNSLTSQGQSTFDYYACYKDYSDDNQAYQANIPSTLTSIRDNLLFPEGPLIFDQPRPDSLNNQFCLSCHTATGQKGFNLGALTLIPGLTAANDPRRQPLQPEAKVYGHIPANWLGTNLPATSTIATNGLDIDSLLLAARTGQSLIKHDSTKELHVDGMMVDHDPTQANYDWIFIESSNIGWFYIENRQNGTRLRQVPNSFNTAMQANVVGKNAQWKFESYDGQSIHIINLKSGHKLNATTTDNVLSTVPQSTDDSDPNTHWQLVAYEE